MEIQKALYMIPVPISGGDLEDVVPEGNKTIIKGIKHYIVENIRTARRFLKKVDPGIDISLITFYELNTHTREDEIWSYLNPLRKGEPVGVMSEAGCPGVADPGAMVVRIAQQEDLRVVPLVGPSSIILSLMASGLNGQKFAFHGYLPLKDNDRDKAIRNLEAQSRQQDITQIFIETPYRNGKMMESLLKNLRNDTLLCVAVDITNHEAEIGESIKTKSVSQWKKEGYLVVKLPTIFLFYCPPAVTGK